MLPFVLVETPRVGGLALHPFGMMMAIGFFLWDVLVSRRGRLLGYDPKKLRSLQLWGIGMGFFWAHVLDQIFYYPERIVADPLSLLRFWENLSSLGGIVGAVIGGACWKWLEWRPLGPIWTLARRPAPLPLLPFADVIAAYLPLCWIFARAGCAIIHDHPGMDAPGGSLLAVAWPRFEGDGLVGKWGPVSVMFGSHPRYDLGLLEMFYLMGLSAAIGLTYRRWRPLGSYAAMACMGYAPGRFLLDFLRASEGVGSDRRVGFLTFAQWTSIAMFAFGVWMWRQSKKLQASPPDLSLVLAEQPAPAE